jgi:hypothetical protein
MLRRSAVFDPGRSSLPSGYFEAPSFGAMNTRSVGSLSTTDRSSPKADAAILRGEQCRPREDREGASELF